MDNVDFASSREESIVTIPTEHRAVRASPVPQRPGPPNAAEHGDLRVVIRAHYASRCAGCGQVYLPGTEIGHSIATDGWVSACCSQELAGRAR